MSLTQTIPAELYQADEQFTLQLARKPETMIQEARICAEALLKAVERNGWAQSYTKNGKPHLYFEAWNFLGSMFRVMPRVVSTTYVELSGGIKGFEATAEAIYIPTEKPISRADAMCLNDEDNWGLRPEYEWRGPQGQRERVQVGEKPTPMYQLRSMAQTRAMAKSLKAPFSWIIAMAGYAPRAAEEAGPAENEQPQQPQRRQQPPDSKITEAQARRIFGIAKSASKEVEEVKRIVASFGFNDPRDITVDKYEAVCAEIQKGEQQ